MNGTEKSSKAVRRFTKDGRPLNDYRFSATNMMIGLDPMVLRAKMKHEASIKAEKSQQRMNIATQTSEGSPDALAWESFNASKVENGNKEDPITMEQNNDDDTSSEAQSVLTPESSSGVDTPNSAEEGSVSAEEHNADTSIEAGVSTESYGESTPAASTDDDDATSGVVSDAETSTKSVTFAEGTSSPASSPLVSNSQPIFHSANASSGPWTMSEDAMVVGMKDQGADWDIIASCIQRTKTEVRKRYYELKCNKANVEALIEAASNAIPDAGVIMEPRASTQINLPNIAESLSPATDDGYVTDDEDNETGEDTEEEDEEEEETDSESSSQASFGNDNEDDQASSADELLDLLREDSSSGSSSITDEADGYDASDYDPFADPADPIACERERRRQERYIRHHAHASMYRGLPAASGGGDRFSDQGFSRRDRALLADLANRRVASQWLEMQANFFNVTGRMVPLHLIKAKLENSRPCDAEIGYLARGERKVANWTDAVADTGEMLDPAQARDAPDDALRYETDDEAHGHMGSVSDKE